MSISLTWPCANLPTMIKQSLSYDIIISGAGPTGLCLAKALSGHGLRIAVIDPQTETAIANPGFDGREIALTQRSVDILLKLDLWRRFSPNDLSPLRHARVINGQSPHSMLISQQLSRNDELGWLISNHFIRRAAYEAVVDACDVTLLFNDTVSDASSTALSAQVQLSSGNILHSQLLVAADSRFSSTRRAFGIAADMHDFGRSMLVCCMHITQAHHNTAWEWFDYGQTLAMLPMNPDPLSGQLRASIVVTLTSQATQDLLAMSESDFNDNITNRFAGRLGHMSVASTRHAYPLVSVYPQRIVSQRFACVGDAAVGMHPVTAHGFNFGLLSVDALAHAIIEAKCNEQDIASSALLARYQSKQQRATRPLFLATHAITQLYTRDSPPARLLRNLLLQFGERATPIKRLLAASLTGKH